MRHPPLGGEAGVDPCGEGRIPGHGGGRRGENDRRTPQAGRIAERQAILRRHQAIEVIEARRQRRLAILTPQVKRGGGKIDHRQQQRRVELECRRIGLIVVRDGVDQRGSNCGAVHRARAAPAATPPPAHRCRQL